MQIQVWKDHEGYAIRTEDTELELTSAGFNQLLKQLAELQAETLSEDDTGTMRDIFLDIEH